jgi:formate-dependent nitrite reductase membrane component NrfD
MSVSDVTRDGIQGARPGREALSGNQIGEVRRRERRGERALVPPAEFRSYYGRPILKTPTWKAIDIAGYLFLGGLAGASSTIAAGAELTGRPALARNGKVAAAAAISLGAISLVHDLGRPSRFVNMLRVMKPTSAMSMGSWLLTAYGPAAGTAAATSLARRFPVVGKVATMCAGLLGPAVASYTAVLISDTAAPAWHDGYREMPFAFVGSAVTAASGLAMMTTPPREAAPAARAALLGVGLEFAGSQLLKRRIGMVGETYEKGSAGALMRAAEFFSAAGIVATLAGRRTRRKPLGRRRAGEPRAASLVAGAAFVAASACARFGIFAAGKASLLDPKYTVIPQRERLDQAGIGK